MKKVNMLFVVGVCLLSANSALAMEASSFKKGSAARLTEEERAEKQKRINKVKQGVLDAFRKELNARYGKNEADRILGVDSRSILEEEQNKVESEVYSSGSETALSATVSNEEGYWRWYAILKTRKTFVLMVSVFGLALASFLAKQVWIYANEQVIDLSSSGGAAAEAAMQLYLLRSSLIQVGNQVMVNGTLV